VTEKEQSSRRLAVARLDTHVTPSVGAGAAELPYMDRHTARGQPFLDLVTKGPLIHAFHFSLLHAAFMIGLSAQVRAGLGLINETPAATHHVLHKALELYARNP
jgi:hypothetical protein